MFIQIKLIWNRSDKKASWELESIWFGKWKVSSFNEDIGFRFYFIFVLRFYCSIFFCSIFLLAKSGVKQLENVFFPRGILIHSLAQLVHYLTTEDETQRTTFENAERPPRWYWGLIQVRIYTDVHRTLYCTSFYFPISLLRCILPVYCLILCTVYNTTTLL